MMRWKKAGTDDYYSTCGRFHIIRFPGDMNRYNPGVDEWTLCENGEAIDVFPLLRDAKAYAVEISRELEKS